MGTVDAHRLGTRRAAPAALALEAVDEPLQLVLGPILRRDRLGLGLRGARGRRRRVRDRPPERGRRRRLIDREPKRAWLGLHTVPRRVLEDEAGLRHRQIESRHRQPGAVFRPPRRPLVEVDDLHREGVGAR